MQSSQNSAQKLFPATITPPNNTAALHSAQLGSECLSALIGCLSQCTSRRLSAIIGPALLLPVRHLYLCCTLLSALPAGSKTTAPRQHFYCLNRTPYAPTTAITGPPIQAISTGWYRSDCAHGVGHPTCCFPPKTVPPPGCSEP